VPDKAARPSPTKLREQMIAAPYHSWARHDAATALLRAILGPGPAVKRKKTWMDWPFEVPEPPYEKAQGATMHIPEGLDPRVLAAYDTVARQYPDAARNIYGIYQVSDPPREGPLDTLGEWNTMGNVAVRSTMGGKPIPFGEMIDSLKHEFGHAMGLPDRSDDPDATTAYDLSGAAAAQRQDINLPYEGPPLVTGRVKPKTTKGRR
jgi:hypothetical protein